MYINTYIATHNAQTQAKTIKEPTDEKGKKITQKLMQMVDYDGVIPGYDIDLVGFQYDEDKVVFEGCQVKLGHKEGTNYSKQGMEDYSGQLFLLRFVSTPPRPVIPGKHHFGENQRVPKEANAPKKNRKTSTGSVVISTFS